MDRDCSADEPAFNLRRLVREVLDTTTMNDPHAIAPEVLRRIDASDLRAALGECLPSLVREMIRSSRNGGFGGPVERMSVPSPSSPRLTLHAQTGTPEVMSEHPGSGPMASVRRSPAKKPGRSAKVAAIRASGPKWLADRINTAADPREWKRVGDCSFAELMFAAGQRREQAARTSAVAERLEGLAELVRAHGVERVRDLPASVLAGVGGAAA
jgi:hypothetical protein